MKNKLSIGAAVAVAATAATMGTASADTLTLEGRNVEQGDADEYVLNYQRNFFILRAGSEISYTDNDVGPDALLGSLNTSVDIQAPVGVVISPKVEVGYADYDGVADGAFWGAAVVAEKDVGPFTLNVGARHREGVDDLALEENRYQAGVRLNFNDHQAVGANYYRYDDAADTEAVGVYYRLAF